MASRIRIDVFLIATSAESKEQSQAEIHEQTGKGAHRHEKQIEQETLGRSHISFETAAADATTPNPAAKP